jgi:hypothetical protein
MWKAVGDVGILILSHPRSGVAGDTIGIAGVVVGAWEIS